MKLINDFYNIIHQKKQEDILETEISIRPEHRIFEGHFPEVAIVPGVCLVQIIRELLELELDQNLIMSSASNIKFLSFVKPAEAGNLHIRITIKPNETGFKADSIITGEGIEYFKMNAEFKKFIIP